MSKLVQGYEVVIGFETHAQLSTQSKIFSRAPTAFGAEANTQACAVDMALPGTLPVMNIGAVERAIEFGLAINAHIAERSIFARKNYFYPDLPKGYQISQFEIPVVQGGEVSFFLEEGKETVRKTVRLERAHLEEDAGKSLHEDFIGQSGIDLNRAGTPLLEIVTRPDMSSSEEAVAYAKELHKIVTWIGICDGNMQEGSFRCDANVSVRKPGEPLGTRREIKNLNSFKFMQQAIDYEIRWQIEEIEDSEPLDWQLTKIEALEELLTENQPVALQILVQNVRGPDATKRRTALAAIVRLRWDTGVHLPDLLTVKPFPPDTDLLFPALCLTKNRNWFPEVITLLKRLVGKLPSGKVEDDENASVLRHVLDLLRQFPGGQSEKILLLCAKSADPAMRRAAVRNLGWWEPVDRSSVLGTLRKSAAMEKTSEVRWAAKAALARLGERKSLNSLRSLLFSEDIAKVHLGIHTVGNEGVSLLWPDLDQLMDSEDEEVSYHAWEATEKLGFQSEMGK